jgi:hypothetical protein
VVRVTEAVSVGIKTENNYAENSIIDAAPAFVVYKFGVVGVANNNATSVR